MINKVFTLVAVLSAVSNTLASPLSRNSDKQSAEANLVARQFGCPPGDHCGPGPVCATIFCHLPACVDAPACQNVTVTSKRSPDATLATRQSDCPPGVACGPGPECTPELCDLPGCADADVCQDSQKTKRTAAGALLDRQFDCPPGVECGHGPECTAELCDLPGCADAEVCQGDQDKKRSADTDIVHPICDICEVNADGVTVCGCATADGGSKKRATERVCPLFCLTTEDGDELCGCAAEDYENSLHGGKPKI